MLPKVNFVDETEIRPPYVHRKRRAGEQILYFIRHGEMHLLEDGKPLILKPGDVCLLDKDRTHEGTKATTCNYYYVHFMHGEMELVDAKEEEVARQQFERRRKAMAKEHVSLMEVMMRARSGCRNTGISKKSPTRSTLMS